MENRNSEIASMLIRFYNIHAGTSCRTNNERSQQLVLNAVERAGGDVRLVQNHIKQWIADNKSIANGDNFARCILDFAGAPAPKVEEMKIEAPATPNEVSQSLGLLEKVVVELISRTQSEKIESEIMGNVKSTIQDFIKSEYGAIERKITTVIDGKKYEPEGTVHEKFDTVLKFVANNEPVFLTGPAGSGKNHLCKQVADALGLKFYFTNAVTQEYKLTGFTDAMGNYQPTQFYEAFKNGGLFMLDEMDASIPEVLVILNAAIANRYFDFPAPIGMVHAHKDFRVIAAGNTTGHGASYEYVGRNQLDAASLDRFAIVKIDYSPAIETAVACGDAELVDFCRAYRAAGLKAGQQIIVSYRAISRLAKMLQILSAEEALETCLTRGMEKDDLNIIIKELPESKFKTALKKIASSC